MDLGTPTSYLTLTAGARVYSADEQELGSVDEVRCAPDLDIFDGIIISGGPPGQRYVDAEHVQEIFEQGVLLKLSAAEADALPTSA